MTTQSHQVTLRLHDDDQKTLGVSHIVSDSLVSQQGLIEGADFEADYDRGLIRRLRVFGRELYTFTMQYDDRSEFWHNVAAQDEKRSQSGAQASNVPGWATWNTETANDWYQANIVDLLDAVPDVDNMTPTAFQANAQAIVAQYQDILIAQANVIQRLGQMVIALRNNIWPNLEQE